MIPKQSESFNKTGNALLMSLMKAEIVSIEKDADFQSEMNKVAKKVKENGGNPYIVPFGGSNYLGSLGYVDCAKEIISQFENMDSEPPDYVIVPTGSGGTHAGLVSGFLIENVKTKTIGVSVLHNKETAQRIVSDLSTEILSKTANDTAGSPEIIVDDNFVGEGYGIPTQKGIEAIHLLAELEALFLCPVYTGKAMSGLVDYINEGKITAEDKVVFIHTGGTPLVYAYFDKF